MPKDSVVLKLVVPKNLKAKKKNVVRVTLKRGVSKLVVTGKVTLSVGTKRIAVPFETKSTVKVTLPKLKKGTYKISVSYSGSPTYVATATTVVKRKAK